MTQKTYQPKIESLKPAWHLLDAEGISLGRLATKIVYFLSGKYRRDYAPHLDNSDYVVVINCAKIKITGKKLRQKKYFRHSGKLGKLKETKLDLLMRERPEKAVFLAVKNMLAKNKLQKRRLVRLKLFVGEKHSFEDKFRVNPPAGGKS